MRCAFACLAVCCVATAQERISAWFTVRAQEADGHWSAARFGGRPEAELRVSAMVLLQFLAEGNTARMGPQRESVARGIRWLATQQDDKGRFQLRADPAWLLDHAIATYAVAEELRLAERRRGPSLDRVLRASAALREALVVARPVPSVELRLWGEMCARSLHAAARQLPVDGEAAPEAAKLRAGADELVKVLASLAATEAGSPRDRAAALLLAVLRAPAAPAGDRLPPEWPEDVLLDPLTTFYVATALYLRGGEPWLLASKKLGRPLMDAQVRDGVEAGVSLTGSWQARGPFGEQNGRLCATAGAVLLLEVYYCHNRLEVCAGD